jgi:hypothetical protein
MTDQDRWELQNEAYLSAALHWIRLRLYQLAGPADAAPDETLPPPPEPGLRERLLGRRPPPRALLAPGGTAVDTELEQAEAAMVEAGSLDPPPALHILARRFGLSEFEQNALLLCCRTGARHARRRPVRGAQHDPARPYPTFALIVALFDDPAWDVLSPERPLRYWRLHRDQPARRPAADHG